MTTHDEFERDRFLLVDQLADAFCYPYHDIPPYLQMDVGPNIESMRLSGDSTAFAVGGKDRLLEVFDLARQQSLWKSRNVSHDWLDMPVPVWDSQVQFLRSSDSSSGGATSAGGKPVSGPGHTILTCTRHSHVRLYDTRAGRQPVQSHQIGESPWMSMAADADRSLVFLGDTTGNLTHVDMRTWREAGRFRGPSGSVRSISLHPTVPWIAATGLDRCLWVFQIEDQQLVRRIYLKQRLNQCLFSAEGRVATKSVRSADDTGPEDGVHTGAAEDDALWAELDRRTKGLEGDEANDSDTSDDASRGSSSGDPEDEGSLSGGEFASDDDSDEMDKAVGGGAKGNAIRGAASARSKRPLQQDKDSSEWSDSGGFGSAGGDSSDDSGDSFDEEEDEDEEDANDSESSSDDDGASGDESDDAAARLVDSAKARKKLRKETMLARRSQQKAQRVATIKRNTESSGKGKGVAPPNRKRRRRR